MPSADVIVVGAGLVGLALARELHRAGVDVLVLEKSRAAAACSWAGAGMLAAEQTRSAALRSWARASARLYPEFVAELEAESGIAVDFQRHGTIYLAAIDSEPDRREAHDRSRWRPADVERLRACCAGLRLPPGTEAWWVPDGCVDNRLLGAALAASVRRSRVRLLEEETVLEIREDKGRWRVGAVSGQYYAPTVVNAAGAWANTFVAPMPVPVRPRKGQMLALQTAGRELRSVLHAPAAYLVPRRDGRVIAGATVEDVGFDAGLDAGALEDLHRAAVDLLPALADAPVVERWFGFRPGSEDDLPWIGESDRRGYWLATGHFRDGILLAPLTALVLAAAIAGKMAPPSGFNPLEFSPSVRAVRHAIPQ